MTDWPNATDPAMLEDLTTPLRDALKSLYSLRRNKTKEADWTGPEITAVAILATSFNIQERLSEEKLNYDADNHGRDALDAILTAAIQLGIEQGLRIKCNQNKISLTLLSGYIDQIKVVISDITNGKDVELRCKAPLAHVASGLEFIVSDLSKL